MWTTYIVTWNVEVPRTLANYIGTDRLKSECYHRKQTHSPYALDLGSDFLLFPKIKSVLKVTHFKFIDAVKAKINKTNEWAIKKWYPALFPKAEDLYEGCKDQGEEKYIKEHLFPLCYLLNKHFF